MAELQKKKKNRHVLSNIRTLKITYTVPEIKFKNVKIYQNLLKKYNTKNTQTTQFFNMKTIKIQMKMDKLKVIKGH